MVEAAGVEPVSIFGSIALLYPVLHGCRCRCHSAPCRQLNLTRSIQSPNHTQHEPVSRHGKSGTAPTLTITSKPPSPSSPPMRKQGGAGAKTFKHPSHSSTRTRQAPLSGKMEPVLQVGVTRCHRQYKRTQDKDQTSTRMSQHPAKNGTGMCQAQSLLLRNS